MQFQKGNKFWLARSSHGRNPIFSDPEQLRNACYEYFEWVEENPLLEEKIFHSQGMITKDTVTKMRAMTISGLCLFLDICENTWANYKKQPDFLSITLEVEKVIYNQKFAGASADLLNANIIARELGLADKQQNEHTGVDGKPIAHSVEIKVTFDD
jgi:hypothetical protein